MFVSAGIASDAALDKRCETGACCETKSGNCVDAVKGNISTCTGEAVVTRKELWSYYRECHRVLLVIVEDDSQIVLWDSIHER